MKRVGAMHCVVYLSVDGSLPREVSRMSYEQWRSGWVVPRKSVLELGEVPEALLGCTPEHWLRIKGWLLYWKVKRGVRHGLDWLRGL